MKLDKHTTGLIYPALLFALFIALFVVPAFAGEWNNKPVMCAPQDETFSAIASKGEVLISVADQLTTVRDPDEADGMSISPAVLPWALYANLETGTFTIVEFHKDPYNVFCIIGFGVSFKWVEEGLKLRHDKGE